MNDDRALLLAACDDACALAAGDENDLATARTGSGWSPARHLTHVALANGLILKALAALAAGHGTPRGGPAAEPAQAVLDAGEIPRGVASAPPGTEPAEQVDLAATRRLLEETRGGFAALELPADAGDLARDHPALGPLTAPEWVRFAAAHTRHHLAIVRDLLGCA